jgi:hypothetical protein
MLVWHNVARSLTQRPLAGIITLEKYGYTSPKEFEGKTVGITGDPSDVPITKWIITQGGGNYDDVRVVTIGFNGVPNLESGKVDAFTGFYPADGVQVKVDGFPTTIFKLDEYGAPSYPGLVVFSTDQRIAEKPGVMQAFVDATIRGYEDTIEDPNRSLGNLLSENPSLKKDVQAAHLDAYVPLFSCPAMRGTARRRREGCDEVDPHARPCPPAGESPVLVIVREPGSRLPRRNCSPMKRSVESPLAEAGQPATPSESCSLLRLALTQGTEGAEPLKSRRRPWKAQRPWIAAPKNPPG